MAKTRRLAAGVTIQDATADQIAAMSTAQLRNHLSHAITRYDRAQATKRHYNVYALGIYLQRVDDVVDMLNETVTLETALRGQFCDRLRDHMLQACGYQP